FTGAEMLLQRSAAPEWVFQARQLKALPPEGDLSRGSRMNRPELDRSGDPGLGLLIGRIADGQRDHGDQGAPDPALVAVAERRTNRLLETLPAAGVAADVDEDADGSDEHVLNQHA